MKNSLRRREVVTLSLITLLVSIAPASHATNCSTASVAGNWAYTYTGTIFTTSGPLPLASVGHYSQDHYGNVTGSQARSVAGSTGAEDISGTISVNRDCTAAATVNVSVNGVLLRTAVLAFVFDSSGKHERAIFQSLTLPDGTNVPVVITVDGNKLNSAD